MGVQLFRPKWSRKNLSFVLLQKDTTTIEEHIHVNSSLRFNMGCVTDQRLMTGCGVRFLLVSNED